MTGLLEYMQCAFTNHFIAYIAGYERNFSVSMDMQSLRGQSYGMYITASDPALAFY